MSDESNVRKLTDFLVRLMRPEGVMDEKTSVLREQWARIVSRAEVAPRTATGTLVGYAVILSVEAELTQLRAEAEQLRILLKSSGGGKEAVGQIINENKRLRDALNIDREDVGRIMHESWTRTKRAQGFHYPSEKHGEGFNKMLGNWCDKCHADLIPWDELPEIQKDINRHAFDDVLTEIRRRAGKGEP